MSSVPPSADGPAKPIGQGEQPADARLQAADALLDKQHLLSEAQRIANIGSWRLDRNGHLVWSEEMFRIHGVVPDKFAPSADSLPALIHPDDRAKVRELLAADFAGGPVAEFEFRVLRPDGSERWVIARTEGATGPEGKVGHLTGTFQDVTERREAEAAVREAAARYRQLFDANPYPMWIYDPATLRFLAVNDAALGHYGYQRDEFLGMTLNDLSAPQTLPPLAEVKRAETDPHPDDLWRHRLRDGRLIDMEIVAQTIDFEGRPARVVLAHDVTERRRVAQDTLDSRAALRALVQRLQSAQEDERARISRHVHDELGQLLSGLKLELRWVEKRLSGSDLPAALHGLLDRTVAASELADQAIAAVQQLAGELRPGSLDHLGLAGALAQRALQFERASGVVCTLDVREPLPPIAQTVSNDLFYICQEALTNVARHAQATQVCIHLRSAGSGVRLEIQDNGLGIDPAVVTAWRSLGLLGMRERALSCGGSLRIEAASPRGTVVVAEVPLAEVPQ